MIRTKTTFILGPGAAAELHMPGPAETLERIAAALDFSRGGANQMTRDTAAIVRHAAGLAEQLGCAEEALYRAAQRIFLAAQVGRTLEGVIDQNDDDPLVAAFGKLALAVFTLQSEQRSSVRATPQVNTGLPLQTGDYWLLELGRMLTAGLPRSTLADGLGQVAVVSLTYDRAVEHVMPYVLATAYGLALDEAQGLIDRHLKVFHPLGSVGRLPWQAADGRQGAPCVAWGDETAANMPALAAQLTTAAEAARDPARLAPMQEVLAASDRLVFMGFDAAPQVMSLLAGGPPAPDCELVVALPGMAGPARAGAVRMLRRWLGGGEVGERMHVSEGRCLDLMKDYALILES